MSSEEIKIYLYLLEHGGETAGHIAQKIGVKRSTLYGVLQKMTDKGVVKRSLRHGVRRFSAENPESLYNLFSKNIEHLQQAQSNFKALLPQLISLSGGSLYKPKIEVFEGVQAVQNIMQDILLYRNTVTRTLWPITSMMRLLAPDYFRWHNKQRVESNISLEVLWTKNQIVSFDEYPYMGVGDEHKRIVKVINGEIYSEMGYWIYQNKILYLSASRKEPFGFIIESEEMTKLQLEQWQLLWANAMPLEVYQALN